MRHVPSNEYCHPAVIKFSLFLQNALHFLTVLWSARNHFERLAKGSPSRANLRTRRSERPVSDSRTLRSDLCTPLRLLPIPEPPFPILAHPCPIPNPPFPIPKNHIDSIQTKSRTGLGEDSPRNHSTGISNPMRGFYFPMAHKVTLFVLKHRALCW